MNVLQRTLFNRGGYAARGTGITSGLINTPKRGYVDGPGSYAGNISGTGSMLDLDNVRTPEELDAIQRSSFPSDGAATDQTVYTLSLIHI